MKQRDTLALQGREQQPAKADWDRRRRGTCEELKKTSVKTSPEGKTQWKVVRQAGPCGPC